MFSRGQGDESLLQVCNNEAHTCQIHQQEAALVQSIVDFLVVGTSRGENLVLVTRESRQRQVMDWLTARLPDADRLERDGRLIVISPHVLIDAVSRDGMPAWELFEARARELLDNATDGWSKPVRYYGDAVSELWESGQHAAAIEIEVLWNRLLGDLPEMAIYCGYLFDALSRDSYSAHLELLAREHGVFKPSVDELDLQCALDQASRELRGAPMPNDVSECNDWRARLPLSVRWVSWLIQHEPGKVNDVLACARRFFGARTTAA